MADQTDKPSAPKTQLRLTGSRIVLLLLGALLLVYIASALLGGLGNYQHLKEAAQDAKTQDAIKP